jgi:sulfur carrier protein
MKIIVNGKPKELATPQNLSEIVSAYSSQPRHIITELNGTIVPPHQRGQTLLKEGDALELVTFVGGG